MRHKSLGNLSNLSHEDNSFLDDLHNLKSNKLANALRRLTQILHECSGRMIVLLIDEHDTPLSSARNIEDCRKVMAIVHIPLCKIHTRPRIDWELPSTRIFGYFKCELYCVRSSWTIRAGCQKNKVIFGAFIVGILKQPSSGFLTGISGSKACWVLLPVDVF